MRSRQFFVSLVFLLSAASPILAQGTGVGGGGAAPSSAPTVTRDERGRATIRAVRITTPLHLDGKLDEEIYTSVPPVGNFVQQVPRVGEPATEPSEMWVFFDDQNVYF